MFSVRFVIADSYQATPLPQLDPIYSEFRGVEIKNVPIIRVFGTTPTGEKTCLHLHGVFPYMYIPYTGEENADTYAYKLAASLDAAINISLGSASSKTQHVYQIQRVAGIPYYGYHRREHQFFKISFYNPAIMKKATDLLQNGSVLNRRLQPHEAHIPYILQFMMDYNLHGMSLINLSNVKYRRVAQSLAETMPSSDSIESTIDSVDYLPMSVIRQSLCQLEVDALVTDILNRKELEKGIELNPGLAAIWEEERARRIQAGLSSDNSELVNPPSPKRPVYHATESDIYQQQRLNHRLEAISQCDESTLSTSTNPASYPLEVNDADQLINASNLGSNSVVNNLDKSQQQQLNDVTSLTSFSVSQGSKNSQSTSSSSNILDAEDMPLVKMLMELACDTDNQESIDDDSVLGTQSSIFENNVSKSDNEDGEDVADLNITCLELDSMSPWDDIEKSPSHLVPVNILENNTEVPHSSGDIFMQDTDVESQDSEESRLPQLDGAGDLSNFLESEEDESVKHDAWPSYLPSESGLEQFGTLNYEPLDTEFESNFNNVMGMSLLLSNNDETSVGINLTVEDEKIPLAAVLNGDPCFTQTAEMDKSDFAELQDQYASLLDSALVPDVYKNSYDSDIVNSNRDRLEEKEMVSLNSRSFRITDNGRNRNLSSENVTPNIQEPDAKVCKNKLNSPSVFDRIDENCKDYSRLNSDSSDYNCNVVATWEELQDSKFIPKRILKRKRFRKARNQLLTRFPILSDSMLARRRGRLRRGLTTVTNSIVKDNILNIVDSSTNTPTDIAPSKQKIDEKSSESSSCDRLTIDNEANANIVNDIAEKSQACSTINPSIDDLSPDANSSDINPISTIISPTNVNSDLNEILSNNSVVDDVQQNKLPDIQHLPDHVSEDKNIVTPIIENIENFAVLSTSNNILIDNNPQYLSHYSSSRSHNGAIPFGKLNHRHCCYSFLRMGLIQNYVFTPDEIWVIEKRKRGKLRSSSPEICNKNCRLPFVPLKKIEMVRTTAELNMTKLSISEMGPENLNIICDSGKVDPVNTNYIDKTSILNELLQSKSIESIEIENSKQIPINEKSIDVMQINCNIDKKNDDNIVCDNEELVINDCSSTQSAQISSTQCLDQLIKFEDNESLAITQIFEDSNSCGGKVSQEKRPIVQKLDETNNSSVENPSNNSSKIIPLSMDSIINDDAKVSMTENNIQLELIKKKRGKRKKIKDSDVPMMTIMQSSESDKLCEKDSDNSVLTSITMETKGQQLCNPIMNTMNEDITQISEIEFIINRESNIISSSQSESAKLNKRPEILCSIDRSKIDLAFITEKSSDISKEKNINASGFHINIHEASSGCPKSIANQTFVNNIDINTISKNDVHTNSHHVQQFDEFDDTTLDVHLCESLYKHDVTSNNTFENSESIDGHTTPTSNCEYHHESEQYTNAVAEANFYAGKNYTIDAISLEIPQCLFEEDSNSDNGQKKLGDLSINNSSQIQSIAESPIHETPSNQSINCDNVNTNYFNLKQVCENNSEIVSAIDNLSSDNVKQHDVPESIDIENSLPMLRWTEINEIIDEDLSDSSNYTSRSSTPNEYCPSNCHDNSNDYFNEEKMVKMMDTILVLRDNKMSNDTFNIKESLAHKEKSNYCCNNDSDNSNDNSNNSLKTNDENNVGSVIKYSPNKISIIRRIYLSKNKNIDKEYSNINATTSNDAKLNCTGNKFRNNRVNSSKVKALSEVKLNNVAPLDEVDCNVNDNIEDYGNSIIENTIEIYSPKNSNVDGYITRENLFQSKSINGFIQESNNNQITCQFEENLTAKNTTTISTENCVEDNLNEEKKIEEDKDNPMVETLNNNSKSDDIPVNAELSKSDKHLKSDVIIEPIVNSVNSTTDLNFNLNIEQLNKIKNSTVDKSSEILEDINSEVELTELEIHDNVIAKTCEIEIENNSHDEKMIETNIPSQSTNNVVDCHNDSMSIAICRKVSIVLERLETNYLNKYLKNNQNVEACDMDMTNNITPSKKKNLKKKSMKHKKCVRFNEQVLIFESDEYLPLIDVENQVEQLLDEEIEMDIPVEKENLIEMLADEIGSDIVEQSIAQNYEELVSNKESLNVNENATVNCNDIYSSDYVKLKDNKIMEEINENENEKEKEFDIEINCTDVIELDCKKLDEVPLQNSVCEYKNSDINMILENNKMINTESSEVTQYKPKIINKYIYEDEKYNSDVAVNQKENIEIQNFGGKSKEFHMSSAIVLKERDNRVNEQDVDCVNEQELSSVNNIQMKNNSLNDRSNEHQDTINHNELLTEIEQKTKAMVCSNDTSIPPTNELNNCRVELSRYKRKRNNISTRPIQSAMNDSMKDTSFVDDIANSYKHFQNSGRILRSYRTSSGYRNKIHTVSIDPKMIFTKVTISDQQTMKKSLKEKFLGHIGLCSMKPRGYGWLPERTMTGSIQLQQPLVVLQRLSPSVLKYYGYTRRFKSNKFGKRFKPNVNKFKIPAYDGPADLSSSDSDCDSDTNITVINSEKRGCAYRSCKKKIESEIIATPKKRKQSNSDDDDDEINQRKHTKRCTTKSTVIPSRMSCRSPRKNKTLRSPSVSKIYSPLNIIVTSPKLNKITSNDSNELTIDNSVTSGTPKKRKQFMHEHLLRNRIMMSSTRGQKGIVRELEMDVKQQLMGELTILNSSVTVPITQSSVALSHHDCQSQNISPNVNDITTIRKNLFSSIENNSQTEVSLSQKNKNINYKDDFDIAIPSTSDFNNFHISNINTKCDNDDSDDDDDDVDDSAMFEDISDEMNLKYSPTICNEERANSSDDNLCNVTFTQYLNSHELTQQQTLSSGDKTLFESKNITVIPKFNPPTIRQILDTMETYNIPKFKNLEPFFSDQSDAPGQKEVGHKILNVPGKGVTDLSAFKSTMENITGINRWRRMKINEFHPTPGAFKSTSIRQSLAGHRSVVITPLLSPPTRKNVIKWMRTREYLRKKEIKHETEIMEIECNKNKKKIVDLEITLQNECSSASDSSVVEGSPGQTFISNLSKFSDRKVKNRKTDEFNVEVEHDIEETVNTITSINSNSSEIAPSLKSILAKSALFKSIEQSKQIGRSSEQIECLTDPIRTNVDNENMQKCKALTRHQFITIFCVEVHVITRNDLLPDPQCDTISALFYAIQSDVPPTSAIKPLEHGVIAICDQSESKSSYCYGTNLPFVITFVDDEKHLFETFIDIVKCSDPEILIGWEIESLSWGYIFQRASKLGINLIEGISRVPTSKYKKDNEMLNNLCSLADIKLPGRIVLDIWRIMKSEIALLTYTFENVMYHVMNERLSCPSFESLTKWWQLIQSRWKVVQHYSVKILGVLRILEQLDIIGRTSEYARLFGIQFYEVFSRGSQYRVESIMLRLAKPFNYIAVSPSGQQRTSMRAMEALPLIMEPESMFYSDPIVVLDFQSLYPSIIIAHNYCFSTCLGRVEYIGQPEPYEFGASVLRVPKNIAMKLQNKVNYAPCGVAFVKPEVRRGILPRMLIEILNTRFMVKKAMKDHSCDDKLLQRVLHSRQKGLKDLANVTYGYTAANFTGRMPCIEVGDSVVSKAKETLERAIKLVESTTKWGARVIYGDTDSLFILVPGTSKDDAFKIGYEIADAVTASNLSPIKLKFEKILYPAILQTKKRYCGYMYETPEQKEPTYLAKGIETVRRDGCPAVSKILEKSLRILFDTKDVSLVKQYVTKQLDKVLSGKVSIDDLTFAKEFRGLNGYKERACVPALELTRRLMKKDPRAIPRRGERVRYIIVAGEPNQALIQCVKSPWELIHDPGLRPNAIYYVTRVIIPPLNRCLNLMGVDVNAWYKDMPRRQILDNPTTVPLNKQKQTIFQYFGTIVCASCGRTSNKGICSECLAHPTDTLIILHERLRWLERINDHVMQICQSCVGRGDIADCISLDCPVLYRRAQSQRDLTREIELRRIIEDGGKLEF